MAQALDNIQGIIDKSKCLVALSGGQDSATCLVLSSFFFDKVFTISFNYGQRHAAIELYCSKMLSHLAKVEEHFLYSIDTFSQLGGSALIEEGDISTSHKIDPELPASFVPGRNYIFLGFVAIKAYQLGIRDIVIGVCETDYSGYPDCRDGSIKLIQEALTFSLDWKIKIHTPLMYKSKKETVLLMKEMSKLYWYKHTHTCYEGEVPPCGVCPACVLREKGFNEAGIKDPLKLKYPLKLK